MARPLPSNPSKIPRFVMMAAVCVIVAALYFAQDVLIPLALATLLTFLLSPLVQRLERWRLHRVPAVILTGSIVFGALTILGYVVWTQVFDLANNVDQYTENILAKVERVRPNSRLIDKLKNTAEKVQQKVEQPEKAAATQTTQPDDAATNKLARELAARTGQPRVVSEKDKENPAAGGRAPHEAVATTQWTRENPLPVAMVQPKPSPIQTLGQYLGLVLGPLGTAGIVAIFTIFMLLSREDLRNRLIRLVGYGQLTLTTQALDDAASRISRYLLAQAIVNGTYGAAIAIGLWLIGMTAGHSDPPFPNVILWGLLCGVLRFIPYIGPWIGAAFPLVLSLAVYKGFGVFVAVGVMFVAIELLSNNVMEPMLYGASTGMSTIAILVSAVFWTWLWGPVGLLLATPLTVCLVVLGKYVPQLKFLDILLGDEPVLAPHERLYQRWLALDPEEAAELVHEFFGERSLEQVYDEMLIPALALAEQDRHQGRLDDRRQAMIRQSLRDLIDELGDEHRLRFAQTGASTATVPGKPPENNNGSTPAAPSDQLTRVTMPKDCGVNVLLLPAHDEADEIVGLMLAQVLEFNQYCVTAASQATLAGEMVEMIESKEADVVCVSALPPSAVAHSRYLCKRLRQRYEELKVIVGLWAFRGNVERAKERIACDEKTRLETTLAGMIRVLEEVTQPMVANSNAPNESRKLKTLTPSSPLPRP